MTPTNTIPPGTAAPSTTPIRRRSPKKPLRRSTRHYRVNVQRAEYLSTRYPLSTVEIRELFEDVPVKQAITLIEWAISKAPDRPYKPLRNWARKNKRGFYSDRVRLRDHFEETRIYNEHLGRKLAESFKRSGRALSAHDGPHQPRVPRPGYRAHTGLVTHQTPVPTRDAA